MRQRILFRKVVGKVELIQMKIINCSVFPNDSLEIIISFTLFRSWTHNFISMSLVFAASEFNIEHECIYFERFIRFIRRCLRGIWERRYFCFSFLWANYIIFSVQCITFHLTWFNFHIIEKNIQFCVYSSSFGIGTYKQIIFVQMKNKNEIVWSHSILFYYIVYYYLFIV